MSLFLHLITVQFHTTTDDKDADTIVSCTINKVTNGVLGPNLAASAGPWGGHLNDDSWSIPFNLTVYTGPWFPGQEYALTVSIDPNGHDTWRFDCQLGIAVPNQPDRVYNFLGHALSQNVRSNTYPFIL